MTSAVCSSERVNSHSFLDLSHPQRQRLINNNNNNSKTMFMVLSSWQSHCESSPGSFDECRMVPNGHRLKTKQDDLGYSVSPPVQASRVYTHHRHLLLLLSPKADTHFTIPWLSQPGWLVTYQDGLPAHRRSPILVLTGSEVAQLRWSRPTR